MPGAGTPIRIRHREGAAAVLLSALIAASCAEERPPEAAAERARIEVRTAVARVADVPDVFEGVGTLNAQERVSVASEIAGTVALTALDFGDAVGRGDVLVRLDDRESRLRADAARAALAQAEAVLARARANHRRASALFAQKVLSQEEFDAALSELRVAEANREAAASQAALAEKHVADTTIRSPLSGFVAERHVSAGQFVSPGTPVMELVAVDPLKLRVDLPEHAIGKVRKGLHVEVRTEAFPGRVFSGAVTRIGSALDRTTRTLAVESAVANPEAGLKPGQFARVRIQFGATPAVLIPRAAVDTFAGTHRVFVVDADGTVGERTVTLGRDLAEEIAVRDGLSGGETVATSNLERLAAGTVVDAERRIETAGR